MTVTLELKPEIESKILEQASIKNLSIENYIQQVLIEHVEESATKSFDEQTPIERARAWKEWVNSHDYITAPPADDSRDSIYDERDLQML
jgi:hypothetical protein